MLLKWIKEDKLDIINENNRTIIDMQKIFKTDIGFESNIYVRLLACAGTNRMLEEREFQNFFRNSEKTLYKLFYKLKEEVEKDLLEQGLIIKEANSSKIKVTEALKQKAKELQELKNFLLNFSAIENKESIKVHIWNDYLIYAQLLGIADKVESEFEKVYPDYNKVLKLNTTKIALVEGITVSLQITARLFLSVLFSSASRD